MSDSQQELNQRLADGDRGALAHVFDDYRDRLRRMVMMRLDPRVAARVDASDVIQEVYLDAQRRLEEYANSDLSLLLWFRLLAGQRIVDMHRFHLRSKKRTAAREVALDRPQGPTVCSDSMIRQIAGNQTSASRAAARAEQAAEIRQAIERLSEVDREVLSLRHFEGLTNAETAAALGISVNAASNRYVRALKHMKMVISE